jgi:hypothetical protein
MAGVEPLPTARAFDLETAPPGVLWLIQSFWPKLGVGIIGGEPKMCKSWVGLDMAISVASGTPCLGHFPVDHAGPSLVFLAEDALPNVRARIQSICDHRGIDLSALDLHVITSPSLRIDVEEQRDRLAASLDRLKPKLLLLDPLVRLHRLDENSSQDVSLLFGFLREIQRTYDLSIAVVHHAGKKHRGRPGQSLRGSSDLHAFVDTLAWLGGTQEKRELHLEHRSAPSPDPMRMQLISNPDGTQTHVEVVGAPDLPEDPVGDLTKRITDLLGETRQPMNRAVLRGVLRVNNQRLGDTLITLEKQHLIQRGKGGWEIALPAGSAQPTSDVQMTLM